MHADESEQHPLTTGDDRLLDVLHEVVDQLFAAGLDVQMALQLVEHDAETALWMHSVAARLDTAITTILRAGTAAGRTTPPRERTSIDTFDALASSLTRGLDLPDYLRTVIDPSVVAHAERMLAERHHIPLTAARSALSSYAHVHGRRVPDVARAVVDGTIDCPAPRR